MVWHTFNVRTTISRRRTHQSVVFRHILKCRKHVPLALIRVTYVEYARMLVHACAHTHTKCMHTGNHAWKVQTKANVHLVQLHTALFGTQGNYYKASPCICCCHVLKMPDQVLVRPCSLQMLNQISGATNATRPWTSQCPYTGAEGTITSAPTLLF